MLILGSSSPRRKEILNFFSLPFKCASPDFNEESVSFKGSPSDYVIEIALGKAHGLKNSDAKILTADTTVYHNGHILNKPKSEDEALEMLKSLAGSDHYVYTGLCGKHGQRVYTDYEATKVTFYNASEDQLKKYHKAIYSLDKAGGYAIQQAGSIIVEKIEGCPYNVMGLPINGLSRILSKLGYSLWDYLNT